MEQVFGTRASTSKQDSEHWMGVSDLMAGLMMVFLFIAISYMRYVHVKQEDIKEVATAYQDGQVAIYESLVEEFQADLEAWDARVDPESLSFEFQSPEVLFALGEIALKERFQEILDNFFPRYLEVLKEHRDVINEVRIEGHTSSIWNSQTTPDEAYFKNMWLSQGRTRSVLNYVYANPQITDDRDWVKSYVAAVGFSSSRPVTWANGRENEERSRRVTFRVITDVDIKMRTILEKVK
jgi:outer membrane protein OmpA-like peptidoglycan-associated protein